MFDPESFKHSQTTEADSTEYEPVPEDEPYMASVSSVETRVTQNGAAVMDVNWRLDCPDIEVAHDRIARQSVWLDLTQDGSSLDRSKGKNVSLGLLREAVGQNVPGEPWAPANLEGAVAQVMVKNRIADGRLFIDAKKVVKI